MTRNDSISTWKATQQVLAMTMAKEKQKNHTRVDWVEVRNSVIKTIENQDLHIDPQTIDMCILMAEKSMNTSQKSRTSAFNKELNVDANVKTLFKVLENFNIKTMDSRWKTFIYLSKFCFWKQCKRAFIHLAIAIPLLIFAVYSAIFSASETIQAVSYLPAVLLTIFSIVIASAITIQYMALSKTKKQALESIKKEGWQGISFASSLFSLFYYILHFQEINTNTSLEGWLEERSLKSFSNIHLFYSPVNPVLLVDLFKKLQNNFPVEIQERLNVRLNELLEHEDINSGHFWVLDDVLNQLSIYYPESAEIPRNSQQINEALDKLNS